MQSLSLTPRIPLSLALTADTRDPSVPVFDVTDFGARGDQVADDTVPILNAIAAAKAAGGGKVRFPVTSKNWFLLSDEIVLPSDFGSAPGTPGTIILEGSGMGTTVLQWSVDLGTGKYGIRQESNSGHYHAIRDLRLRGPGTPGTKGVAPANMSGIKATSQMLVERFYATGFWAGIDSAGDHHTVRDFISTGNYYGIYLSCPGGDIRYERGQATGNTLASLGFAASTTPNGMHFEDVHMGFGPYGIYYNGASLSSDSVEFVNCPVEDWGNSMIYAPNLTLSNWFFVNCVGGTQNDAQKVTASPKDYGIVAADLINCTMVGECFAQAGAVGWLSGNCDDLTGIGAVTLVQSLIASNLPVGQNGSFSGTFRHGSSEFRFVKVSSGSVAQFSLVGDDGLNVRPFASNAMYPLGGVAATAGSANDGILVCVGSRDGFKVLVDGAAAVNQWVGVSGSAATKGPCG